MKQVFNELIKELESGRAAVLATIVTSWGSAPRKAGARMLVREDGSISGTVGGGAVEYQTILAAAEALVQKSSFLRLFGLSNDEAADIGMVCGGKVEVYLQYLPPEVQVTGMCRELLQALEQNRRGFLILDITDEHQWKMSIEAAAPDSAADREERRYAYPLAETGMVYIFGGGHVAQELVPLLSALEFRCVVADDRAEFSSPEVFPQAEQTLVVDLEHVEQKLTIGPSDYVCVMTRGHQYDYYVQKQAMRRKPAYIGIMGSRNKIRVVTEKLLADGFSPEEIKACHMPIGTDIKAETPAEIAVSIAGELIAVRAMRRKALT